RAVTGWRGCGPRSARPRLTVTDARRPRAERILEEDVFVQPSAALLHNYAHVADRALADEAGERRLDVFAALRDGALIDDGRRFARLEGHGERHPLRRVSHRLGVANGILD